MANAMVGALFATLGLDTAVFQKGLSDAELQAKGFAASTGKIGNLLKTGLAAGFVAAGAAAVAAGGFFIKSGLDALEGANNITLAAQLANASTTEFQRMAAASATVGIEQDKLADILKDVNDRVGDFLTTGGGPMADFFENIGPKVGVTAQHFKNLSGPEALQLYVKSLQDAGVNQQEMTFYMEAMASDATALIPLLANGGAAMTALGDAAQKSGRIMDEGMIKQLAEAKLEIDNAKLAFSQMSQVVAGQVILSSRDYLKSLGPMIEQGKALAGQIGEFLGPSFKELATTVQTLMAGPFGKALVATLKVIAQVAGTVVVVALKVTIEVFNALFKTIDTVARGIADFIKKFTTGFEFLSNAIPVFVRKMVDAVTGWLQGKLFDVLRGVIDRVRAVSDAFFRLYDAVVGNSYVPDMVKGVAEWMAKLDAVMVDPARRATETTAEAFERVRDRANAAMESMLTDGERAFRDFNRIAADLQNGIARGGPDAAAYRVGLARLQGERDSYGMENRTNVDLDPLKPWGNGEPPIVQGLQESRQALDDAAKQFGDQFAYHMEGVLRGDIKGVFNDILSDMFRNLLKGLGENLFKSLHDSVGSGGGFMSVLSSVFKALPGFKTGGSFKVGGSGGADSQLMAFRATPGEMVDIRRPGQDVGGAGGRPISFDLRGAVMTSDLLAQMQGMATASGGAAFAGARDTVPGDMARASRYTRGRR